MSNRPVGRWSRPSCPGCGLSPVDTDHAFLCQNHVAALSWFWAVTQTLAPSSTISNFTGAILGGCAPCSSLSGFSGPAYVWEVLRISFISVLYRLWIRAAISVQHENGSNVFYESRHIILSTVASVRRIIRLDARRARFGVSHILRDGTLIQINRFGNFYNASWKECGWGMDFDLGSPPFFGTSFPIRVNLSNLHRINIPAANTGSSEAAMDFVY